MAGNKMNAKAKTKDDRVKSTKSSGSPGEASEDLDFSILRKPVLTSITGFAQARKVFDLATEELKSLLTNECDILYECKVCRNIFRSLANFISHKRIYCKDRFDSSVHGHFVRSLSVASEISRIKKLEELYNDSLKDEDITILNQKCYDDRIPLTKDLTEIIERLASGKGKHSNHLENPNVVLQKIPKSNAAVFQSVEEDGNMKDLMRAQVRELNMIMSRENAVLNTDGTVEIESSIPCKRAKEAESVIQISDDENNDEGDILKCKICDLQFSTLKTLKFHMKYKHLESRLVYPCPDCLEIFSTSWSVYRHLFKVHRKTAAQIRRLRESIQAKAFRMNNPPAFYERRRNAKNATTPQKITEEERLDQENQAWMDNLEGDGEVPRCGGCGRTFERRAALAAHTHTCQPRSRALARRPPDARKIEIQIRKDYNKAPPPPVALPQPVKLADSNGTPLTPKVADPKDKQATAEETPDQTKSQRDKDNVPERIEEHVEQKTENAQVKENSQTETTDEYEINKVKIIDCKIKLPLARQAEKSNFNSLTKRCQSDIEIDKLLCKKCDNKFEKVSDLYDHMAEHYKWLRYACKLCNYKHYDFEKLPEHVKVVHKLKGDTDFYYSTVKAIDGTEALQLSECSKETNDSTETSPNSRRPSRCSSDSSRLSDDSSSSSTRVEGTRKRKMKYNKVISKKKKEVIDDTDGLKDSEVSSDMPDDNDSSNVKIFEENSSDIEEVEEKSTKKRQETSVSIMSSRRPVRKRTNKKNEDFEYDLSNLLKLEAQGYRDSQSVVTSKTIPPKKKSSVENQNNIVFYHDKDYSGALALMSKRAVETSSAHLKSVGMYAQSDVRAPNIFLRPLLPKISRQEKVSPKKEDMSIQNSSLDKELKTSLNVSKDIKEVTHSSLEKGKLSEDNRMLKNTSKDLKEINNSSIVNSKLPEDRNTSKSIPKDVKETTNLHLDKQKLPEDSRTSKKEVCLKSVEENSTTNEDKIKPACDVGETSIPKINVPAVVPLKFRRQSLDLIKNPLIKKNITDFSKAGMKTKILVIKPINRNQQDGGKTINTPLKFQTIKLKDPNKNATSSDAKLSDQVKVVRVPTVDRTVKLPVTGTCIKNDSNITSHPVTDETASNSEEKIVEMNFEESESNEEEILEECIPEILNTNSAELKCSPDVDDITRTKETFLDRENTLATET